MDEEQLHHIVHVKHLKMAMKSGKSNKVVKLKLKRLKTHYEIPLEPLPNAVVKYMSKKKLFGKHDKKKPLDVKSNKKGETKRICLVLHDKNNTGKSDIKTATMMKKSATASSSSPCPSSPEAMIPKNISHGP